MADSAVYKANRIRSICVKLSLSALIIFYSAISGQAMFAQEE